MFTPQKQRVAVTYCLKEVRANVIVPDTAMSIRRG